MASIEVYESLTRPPLAAGELRYTAARRDKRRNPAIMNMPKEMRNVTSEQGGVSSMIQVKVLSACAVAGTMVVFVALSSGGRSAGQDGDPAELVKDLHAPFGEHHARAAHAKGVVLDGTFDSEALRQAGMGSSRWRSRT
jgi:hypothetical protein